MGKQSSRTHAIWTEVENCGIARSYVGFNVTAIPGNNYRCRWLFYVVLRVDMAILWVYIITYILRKIWKKSETCEKHLDFWSFVEMSTWVHTRSC